MKYALRKTTDHDHGGLSRAAASHELLFRSSPAFRMTEQDLGRLQGWPGIENPILTGIIQKDACLNSLSGVIATKAGAVGAEAQCPWLHDFRHPSGNTARPAGENIFMGLGAGNFTMGETATSADHASFNVCIGGGSGGALTTGFSNLGVGYGTLRNLTSGYGNNAQGFESLASLTTGIQNTGVGQKALVNLVDGEGCTAIGMNAGRYHGSGTNPLANCTDGIYIGRLSRAAANDTENEVVIGANAVGNGSNTVTIGGDDTTDSFIAGSLNLSAAMKMTVTTTIGKTGADAYIPVFVNGTMRYIRLFD